MDPKLERNLGIFDNFRENGGKNGFTTCTATSLSEEERQSLLNNPGTFIVHSVKKKVFGGTVDGIVSITCETDNGFEELIRSLS